MRRWWKPDRANDSRPGDGTPEVFATFAPFFLRRLGRLHAIKASTLLSPLERRLVDRALYSTYWDCVSVDARDEAKEALGHGIR